MKREVFLTILVLFIIILIAGFAKGAEICDLDATLVNQDPYPAIPGDYVKLVFQLTGVDNSDCGTVTFKFLQEYPFSLDPGEPNIVKIESGFFLSNYKSFLMIPYKVRVDERALDGENEIEISYSSSKHQDSSSIEKFNISVEGLDTEFEISIKDYKKSSNTLTFEILNIGEHDVEALVVEIPKQETIVIKGSNRNIVGSLDKNEDTTFNFEAIPKNGEIELKIIYNDEINVRRELMEKVLFDSSYFEGRIQDQKSTPFYVYLLITVVVIVGVWYVRKKIKDKKKKNSLTKRR